MQDNGRVSLLDPKRGFPLPEIPDLPAFLRRVAAQLQATALFLETAADPLEGGRRVLEQQGRLVLALLALQPILHRQQDATPCLEVSDHMAHLWLASDKLLSLAQGWVSVATASGGEQGPVAPCTR